MGGLVDLEAGLPGFQLVLLMDKGFTHFRNNPHGNQTLVQHLRQNQGNGVHFYTPLNPNSDIYDRNGNSLGPDPLRAQIPAMGNRLTDLGKYPLP